MIRHNREHTRTLNGFTGNVNLNHCVSILRRIIILCVLSCITQIHTSATNTHYIIAFDQCVGKYDLDYLSTRTLTSLSTILESSGFDISNDYLSMVGYSIEMGRPSMERFVRPYIGAKGDTIIWEKLQDTNLSRLFVNWPQGQPVLDRSRMPFGSMQSVAKPYIVMETKSREDKSEHADRTILLLVTDEKVNGTDDNYTLEWNSLATSTGANTQMFNKLSTKVFQTMQSFNEDFKFVRLSLNNVRDTEFLLSEDGKYKVIPYEVVAVDKPSIHSISDLPFPLPLRRVKGGFRLRANVKSINDQYKIKNISFFSNTGKLLGQTNTGEIDFVLPSKNIQSGDTITVSMSLLMIDGLYDGVVISSSNPRYTDGMVEAQIVNDDETKILGLFPLLDAFWWWFQDDIVSAVLIWDIIIILSIIGCVVWLIYIWNRKTLKYHVEPTEITMRCVRTVSCNDTVGDTNK